MDQREGRLKRIDMANTLRPPERSDVEVGDPAGAHLPLLDQARHLAPRVLYRGADRVRPMKLVQVDPVDAEPAQRRLDFFADRFRPQVALRLRKRLRWVSDLTALGEDERTLGGRDLAQRPTDDLLGMAESIDGRGVDPVDAGRDRMLDRGNRSRVVLASPAVGPTAAADGPRPEADLSDLKPARSEGTCT